MRATMLLFAVVTLSACAGDSNIFKNSLCSMRESACKQSCSSSAMKPAEAMSCRQSCEDSSKGKCG